MDTLPKSLTEDRASRLTKELLDDARKTLDSADEKCLSFYTFVQTSTKVADEVVVGQKFDLDMLPSGKATFSVTDLDGNYAGLITESGTRSFLKREEDGWHDSRIRISASAAQKLVRVKVSNEP